MTTYQHARHLHNLGFSLIPIRPDTKIPAVKWKRYQTERCTEADLRRWFDHAGFAIGIVTGAVSGIVAVDCDDAESIAAMGEQRGLALSLVRQRTRRGLHLIYRHPGTDTRNTVRCLAARVDVRGDGGYIRAYDGSSHWTATELALAPIYQPLPHETPAMVS